MITWMSEAGKGYPEANLGAFGFREGDAMTWFINGSNVSLRTLHYPKVTREPTGHCMHSLWFPDLTR